MKKFFKTFAILIIIAHVFAGIIYAGVIPFSVFRNFKLPEAGRFAEFILRLQNENGQDEADNGSGEPDLSENELDAEEAELGEEAGIAKQQDLSEVRNKIRVEFSENRKPASA